MDAVKSCMAITVGFGIDYQKSNELLEVFRDRGYFRGEDVKARIDSKTDECVIVIDGISLTDARFFGTVLQIAVDGKLDWMHSEEYI